jgi:hypothetical protein
MAWPIWLVPPPPSPASANRGPDTASPSPGALPALPGAGDAPASPSRSLTVVKPRATRPIAPLHDLKPGGGEPWLVGRWLKWSQDKLNALDKSTAEALPAVERDVKRRVGRVALAITQEYIHQFPPLEVYLADRAFEMDEMRNAATRARLAERAAKAMSDADEYQTEDAREKDEDEPASPERTEPKPTETEAKTETESRAAETTPSTASKPPSASKKARRKLTDFFFAGGHDAAVEAATDAREETKRETTKTQTQTPTRPSPPAERADPVRSVSAKAPSASTVEETRAGRRETDREREARWAREGAALAASLAAPRSTRRASSASASRARRSKPADENAPQSSTVRVPDMNRYTSERPPVSRGFAAAVMAPVAAGSSTAAAALGSPPRTTLDAPSAETMERPTRVAEAPAPIPSSGPRARSSSVRVTVDGVDVAERRMEREARRAARAAAREERTARARVEGDATVEGTPSKRRGLRDVSNMGAVGGAVGGAKGPYVDMLSRLRAAAQSTAKAWNDLATEKFDGGGEFRAASGSAGGDKVRLESVVTMSVDGADVLVQTREVSVAGKQS